MVIAIDSDLITRQGSLRATIEYVNLLISSANIIYESELSIGGGIAFVGK